MVERMASSAENEEGMQPSVIQITVHGECNINITAHGKMSMKKPDDAAATPAADMVSKAGQSAKSSKR